MRPAGGRVAQPAISFARPPWPAIKPYSPARADPLHFQPVFSARAVTDMVVSMDNKARAHSSRQRIQRRNALRMA
jgi:hypothetical protein